MLELNRRIAIEAKLDALMSKMITQEKENPFNKCSGNRGRR